MPPRTCVCNRLWLVPLLLLCAVPAYGQISMQMSNGWTFTFAGNVGTFLVYEKESANGQITDPMAVVGSGRQGSAIRSGLLPAFAVLDARGREGKTDLGVHFGIAPVIQTGGGHDNDTSGTGAGARIDMRQVYLTVGGNWGQVLAGREIGLFLRQNILTDQSLFGVGAAGGNFGNPSGTTLGRIGLGYIYPGFNAQITYRTPLNHPLQLSVGLFDPSTNNDFQQFDLPRLETEATYTRGPLMSWIGGLMQTGRDTLLDAGATAWGLTGGVRVGTNRFSVVVSGYGGRGIGTTTMFRGGRSATGSTALRPSHGYLGQVTFTPGGRRLTLAGSYGRSTISNASAEPEFHLTNSSVSGGGYFQATHSLKLVAELTWAQSNDDDPATHANRSITGAGGLMLFF